MAGLQGGHSVIRLRTNDGRPVNWGNCLKERKDMKRSWILTALALPVCGFVFGCNDAGTTRTSGTSTTTERTTTTTEHASTKPREPAGNVRVEAGPNGATTAGGATNGTAASGRGGVNVDVVPGEGVNVDVRGEPIRQRIRERQAARETNLPR